MMSHHQISGSSQGYDDVVKVPRRSPGRAGDGRRPGEIGSR